MIQLTAGEKKLFSALSSADPYLTFPVCPRMTTGECFHQGIFWQCYQVLKWSHLYEFVSDVCLKICNEFILQKTLIDLVGCVYFLLAIYLLIWMNLLQQIEEVIYFLKCVIDYFFFFMDKHDF